ncbi:MAG: MobP3 family relaxase [Candidatus Borkfalkiaceae bacterium]|nr:MobP3 family relaxase [Clostridia bacterium]MDY6223513.1 MobP3 family relaxase [Christensenellaceae bacterium]
MARLIVKWRYIKPGAPKQGEHYVDYIATREGVEIGGEKWKDEPATKEQEKLVNRLIADFPDCKNSFEYQDYLSVKTKYTATEFIDKAIEENVDRIGKKENYIGYIAMRPRVEKSGSHGLFSYSDEPIKLSKVAKEVGNHDGVVWTTVISLKREDAAKLGYDNLPAWKTLLRAKSQDLANAMSVPITDMKWYAAYHNESGHPHVHLVSYSAGKEPYMTRQGLEKLKAAYAHEIFKNDLYEIYEKQTEYRDELRVESKEKIAEIIRGINDKNYENETIELMLKTLAEKLQKHKGKKVYGYLPKDVKNLVNGVIDELMRDNDLQKLYELWYKQRENVLKTYRDKMPARLSLSANEEFKSVRNAVIAEALNLSFSSTPVIDETLAEPTDKEIEKSEKKPRTAWQFYDWAKACADKNGENYNPEFAVKLFTEAASGGITVAKYKLGKMFLNGDGVEKDIPKAVEWLKQAALEENEFAEYALGRIYLFGVGVEKDLPLAMEYLRSAAAKGNEYAAELIRQKELFDKQSISLCISRLFKYLCGVLQEKAEAEFSAKITRTDKKLRRRIAEKKQAQGLKLE